MVIDRARAKNPPPFASLRAAAFEKGSAQRWASVDTCNCRTPARAALRLLGHSERVRHLIRMPGTAPESGASR
jgi:hypothetical protein